MKNLLIIRIIMLLLLVLASGVIYNDADRDLWHRFAMGKIVLTEGKLPYKDPFAYTEKRERWIDHEWGSGVIFWYLYNNDQRPSTNDKRQTPSLTSLTPSSRLSPQGEVITTTRGEVSLILLKDSVFLAVLIMLFFIEKSRKESLFLDVLFFFAMLQGFVPTVRCQIFTYFFFSLWLIMLEKMNSSKDLRKKIMILSVFPSTVILWCNLHGGFVAGFGLILLNSLDTLLKKKIPVFNLIAFFLSALATLINPYGLDFWFYIFEAASMPRPYITEWQHLNIFELNRNWIAVKLLIVLIAASLIFEIRKGRIKNISGIITLLATLYLGINHVRHITFFAVTSLYYGREWIINLFDEIINKLPRLLFTASRTIITALCIAVSIYILTVTDWKIKIPEKTYPVHAVEFIASNNIKGNILVPLNWGSYTFWKLYPENLVSLDGRYEEVYTNETYNLVTEFAFGYSRWRECLERFEHNIILIPVNSPVNKYLKQIPEWNEIYRDNYAVIYVIEGRGNLATAAHGAPYPCDKELNLQT